VTIPGITSTITEAVVGTGGGTVEAFNAATGTALWSATAPGPVTASCSSPCQPLWTAATGPVTSSPAVANGVVYAESDTGTIYAFPASCSNPCSPLWTWPTGNIGTDNVTSSPAVAYGLIYVGASTGMSSGRFFAFAR
jgi:outer membrane protein assembly factor BamB